VTDKKNEIGPRTGGDGMESKAAATTRASVRAFTIVLPLRRVVAVPPGATTDTVARLMQPRLAGAFGQPVVVDNRGRAGGNIGESDFRMSPAR